MDAASKAKFDTPSPAAVPFTDRSAHPFTDPPPAHGMALHQFYLDAQASVDTSSAGGGSLTSTLGWDGEQQLDLTTTVDVKGDMGTLGEQSLIPFLLLSSDAASHT